MPNGQSGLGGALSATSNFFDAIDGFFTDNSIDVMYKALAMVMGLATLYFIPFTRKFSVWAALAIFFILMLQSSPTQNVNPAPAMSTLPMPTQINTPVPAQGGQSPSQQSQQSGGNGGTNWLNAALSILPFLGL